MTDTTPDTGTDAETPTETPPSDTPPAEDLSAEVEKWKAQARKHEDRAKANAAAAKELEQVKAASMTEQERAVEQARAETRTATLIEVGGRLAAAEVRVAAAGRFTPEQLDSLLENVDLSKFVTDDGDVDADKVRSFVDGIAPQPQQAPPLDLGQGARSGTPALGSDPLLQALKNTVGAR